MYHWTKHRAKFLIITLCAVLVYSVSQGERWFTPLTQPQAHDLNPPKYFGDMVYDISSNPLTAEGIALGRALFYDPILSYDSTISCASCHSSYTAFSHVDHALSHGIGDTIGKRNAPPIQNVGWHKMFRWDGGLTHLDAQVMAPLHNATEMASNLPLVFERLRRSHHYPALFEAAFGDTSISTRRFIDALVQFQLILISDNAKYDSVRRGEAKFTAQEKNGFKLFKRNCASCHKPPLFMNNDLTSNNLPIDSSLMDLGRYHVTQRPQDSLLFKTPSLRNIEYTFPYMHDGRFKTIYEVLNHYNTNVMPLSHEEQTEIYAFLLTLSDYSFIRNPDFAFPR